MYEHSRRTRKRQNDRESRTATREPRTANCEPRTANHEPRTTNREPRTTNHELHLSNADVATRRTQHELRAAAVHFSFDPRFVLAAEERHRHFGVDVAAARVRIEIDRDARRELQGNAAAGSGHARVGARLT